MNIKRSLGWSVAICLPAALLLNSTAMAQTDQQAAQAAQAASVVISGKRGAGGDPSNVIAAKSKVLSSKFASSCAFMGAYNANDEDAMQNYLRDYNMTTHDSSGQEVFSDVAPNGDVSNAKLATSIDDPMAGVALAGTPSVGCAQGDKNFAAARNRIARKDKTLAEGFAALGNNDYAGALKLLNTAWDKVGYEEAALMLGKMHLYGMGTPRDTDKAITWFKKVIDTRYDPSSDKMRFDPAAPAEMNERCEAAMTLAKIYLVGMGTKRDVPEAKKWYAKAAEFGYVPAANTLAMSYLSAKGAERNVAKAVDYLKESAEVGYVPAQYNLGKLYYTGDGIGKDLKMAGAYFALAAKSGNADAMYAAGRMYDLGEGVKADETKAIAFYKDAAVKGNPDAQSALATYFYNGQVVAKNLDTARKLFSEAAFRGQPDAMFNLGVMLALGEGGGKDLTMSYVWLSLAKASGHAPADAALKAVAAQMGAPDVAKAEAMLKPKPKAAQVN